MTTNTRNSHGLFDSPVRSPEKEVVILTREDIERQLDAGAFMMSREEAIQFGFLSPHDDPDTVIVDAREEGA